MAVIIEGITLDDAKITSRYDYYKTRSLEIIGGSVIYTIYGTISIGDSDTAQLTGSQVMSKLKSIRDIGKNSRCVNAVLDTFYTGPARVISVNIDQGNDPAWVNQGAYTIELKTNIDSIPPNSLGILAEDCVTNIDLSENISLSEDSHGYLYNGGEFSKSFVVFTNKINITCQPVCPSDGDALQKALIVLRRLISFGPKDEIFVEYKTWTKLFHSRNMSTNSDGSVSFNSTVLLVPPCAQKKFALVDLNFAHNKNYIDKTENRTISGNIIGLISISWSDIITLPSTCIDSKLSAAEEVLSVIKTRFSNINSWEGEELTLILQPNCPPIDQNSCIISNPNEQPCVKPTIASVSKSRTEGSIDFSFEWATNDSCDSSGFKIDLSADTTYREPIIIEHVIPMYGTLLQDLRTHKPLKYEFSASLTSDSNACASFDPCVVQDLQTQLEDLIEKYIGARTQAINFQPDGTGFLLINNTISRTLNSLTLKRDYVQQCL